MPPSRAERVAAHTALADARLTSHLFRRIWKDSRASSLEDLKNFKATESLPDDTNSSGEIERMPWGKHKGRLFVDIPKDYFQWLLSQDWTSEHPDLMDAVRAFLKGPF